MTFLGYRRPDGRVGVRNKIFVLPASVCASDTTRIIASQIEGAVTFNNQNGCSQVAGDQQLTMDVMAGMAANPNVYGIIVVSLGCENCQMDLVVDAIRERTNKPMETFIIQENGGTISTIEKAVRAGRKMAQEASKLQREEFPMSELIVGTECGGSDPTSGLASNVLIGELSDRMVELGGTSILSETTEFIGAEHILAKRGKTPEISERIYEIVHRYEKALQLVGEEVRDGNPSPGNIKGGLTTLEEKSLGCIHKGGHTEVTAVYDYGKQVSEKGLVIMDTPGNDPSSVAGMGFSNVGLGIVHSMAHPLGAFYDTPHGIANAIILPTVMEYNAESTGEKYREIARAMGVKNVDNMTQKEYREAAVNAVKKLSKDVGIASNLIGIVKEEDIPALAQSAFDDACRPGNPKDTSVEEIAALYRELLK